MTCRACERGTCKRTPCSHGRKHCPVCPGSVGRETALSRRNLKCPACSGPKPADADRCEPCATAGIEALALFDV